MFTEYFIGHVHVHVHVLYSLAVLSNDSVYMYTILDLSTLYLANPADKQASCPGHLLQCTF